MAALEEIVQTESQPIEERLRSQLMAIMQMCQDKVALTYRESATTMRYDAQTNSENMNNSLESLPALHSSTSNTFGETGMQTEEQSRGLVPSLSPLPSPQNHLRSGLQLPELDSCASSSMTDKTSLDSGYGSNNSIITSTNAASLEKSNESADILSPPPNLHNEQQPALGDTAVIQCAVNSGTEMLGNVNNTDGLANIDNEWDDSWMQHCAPGDLDIDWNAILGSGQALGTNQVS
jgi:hypothetical protein